MSLTDPDIVARTIGRKAGKTKYLEDYAIKQSKLGKHVHIVSPTGERCLNKCEECEKENEKDR